MVEPNLINLTSSEITGQNEEFLERLTKQAYCETFTKEIGVELRSARAMLWHYAKLFPGVFKFRQETVGEKLVHVEEFRTNSFEETQGGIEVSAIVSIGPDPDWEDYVTQMEQAYASKTPKQALDLLRRLFNKNSEKDDSTDHSLYWNELAAYLADRAASEAEYLVDIVRVNRSPQHKLVLAVRPQNNPTGCFVYFELQSVQAVVDFDVE